MFKTIHDFSFILIIFISAGLGYAYGRGEVMKIVEVKDAEIIRVRSALREIEKKFESADSENMIVITPTPSKAPLSTPTIQSAIPTSPQSAGTTNTDDGTPWGVARQIDEHTWTMKIQMDDRMGTPQEIFDALNEYRYRDGREKLHWDDRLAEYALSRAKHFTSIRKTDAHAGFMEYVKDIENVKKLGFWSIGENSSYGYRMIGVHLIEWVYAGDEPHDLNQLNSRWTHVGIGVDGTQTDLIFGGNKM
jgi:uncharacterized protein YkwD